jgi:hypothetical protein
MKKHLIIIGIVAILVSVGLSGCYSSTPKDKVVGEWLSKEYLNGAYLDSGERHYTFYGNGTCVYYLLCVSCGPKRFWESYVFTGAQLILTRSDGNITTYEYSFSSDNKQLTLTIEGAPHNALILQRLI